MASSLFVKAIFCLCTLANSCSGLVTSKNGYKIFGPLPNQNVVVPIDSQVMLVCNHESNGSLPYAYWAVERKTNLSTEVETFLSTDVSRCWHNVCVSSSYTSVSTADGEASTGSTSSTIMVGNKELDVRIQIFCGLTSLEYINSPLSENITSDYPVEIFTFGVASSLKVSLSDGEVSLTWLPPKISLGFEGSITFKYNITLYDSVDSSPVCSIVTGDLSVNQTQLLDSCELNNNTEYLWSVSVAVNEEAGKAVMCDDTFNLSLEYILVTTSSPTSSKWPTGSRPTQSKSSDSSNPFSTSNSRPFTTDSHDPVTSNIPPLPNGENEFKWWYYVIIVTGVLVVVIIIASGIACVIKTIKIFKSRKYALPATHPYNSITVYIQQPETRTYTCRSETRTYRNIGKSHPLELMPLKSSDAIAVAQPQPQAKVSNFAHIKNSGSQLSKYEEKYPSVVTHLGSNYSLRKYRSEGNIPIHNQETQFSGEYKPVINTSQIHKEGVMVGSTGVAASPQEYSHPSGTSEYSYSGLMEEGVINPEDTKADVTEHSEQHNGKESENSSKDFPESTSSHDDDVHTVDGSPIENEQIKSQDYRPTLRRQISNQYGGDLVYANNRRPHLPQQRK